ncbi:unnamed protein product [Rotaria sp. Silwood1]|nr:unnamed protein product [Rotaria sp. Silwood1]CAF1170266.1 unnamed protein product [Rotaria sp. Silwood1]CAF3476012.1 unnamed protein product [Rotaria sp. Silwood1]CAF4919766.1 unnamed protein product [Rotaria sp. Silwood1]
MSPRSSTLLQSMSQNQSDIFSTSIIVQELMFNRTLTMVSSDMNDNPQFDDINNNSSLVRYRLLYRNYHGFISSAVCIFGLTCNLFNIIVLTRPLMRSSTNTILTSLALSDLLKMLFVLPAAILFYCLPKDDAKSEPDPTSYFQVKFYMIQMLFTLTLHCISTWLTVYLAAFRYVFLSCKSLTVYVLSPDRAFIGVIIVAILATILCIPSYVLQHIVEGYFNDTQSTSNNSLILAYRFEETSFSKSISLRDTVFVLHGVIFKLIPCIFLLLFSFLLIQQLRNALEKSQLLERHSIIKTTKSKNHRGRLRSRKREKENRRTTLMLVIVCVLFLITELPQGAILLLTFLSKNNSTKYFQIYQHLGDTFDILALINNSVNFILYCLMSQAFRDTFKQTFCCCQKLQFHQSAIVFSKLKIKKRGQKTLNQSVTFEIISTYKSSPNGHKHLTPIVKSLSDNENRNLKQTSNIVQFFNHTKSASL